MKYRDESRRLKARIGIIELQKRTTNRKVEVRRQVRDNVKLWFARCSDWTKNINVSLPIPTLRPLSIDTPDHHPTRPSGRLILEDIMAEQENIDPLKSSE
jgi:hypothetical protein